MKQDEIIIEVLADGTLKTTTDKISGPNHSSAAGFIQRMFELAGGKVTTKHRHGGHVHSHEHAHEHQHEGHSH